VIRSPETNKKLPNGKEDGRIFSASRENLEPLGKKITESIFTLLTGS